MVSTNIKEKRFDCGGNLKISLYTVRHLASCNLGNFGVSLRRFHEILISSRNLIDFLNYNKPLEMEHWAKMGYEKS